MRWSWNVPAPLAALITEADYSIGWGGAVCDGQVLVWHDVQNHAEFAATFCQKYADLHESIVGALQQYKTEVEEGMFPAAEHSFTMKEEELAKLKEI